MHQLFTARLVFRQVNNSKTNTVSSLHGATHTVLHCEDASNFEQSQNYHTVKDNTRKTMQRANI